MRGLAAFPTFKMQQSVRHKRRQLAGAHRALLSALIESRGEMALALELRLTRQTLARAAAGLALNSATHAALASYLRLP